jgi:addiction module RelE/StbE family toxin
VKPIRRHKVFDKNFRRRVLNSKSIVQRFEERLKLFLSGERGYPLDDHALIGRMKGLRSFSISGDIRLVYRETEQYYEFLDIGTHNQVY